MLTKDLDREAFEASTYPARYDIATMNYDRAYYKSIFCPEHELKQTLEELAKFRSIWFNLI